MFIIFFNDTATTEIYTLSLHDALPISPLSGEITAVNEELSGTPELINEEPYDRGWLVRVKLSDPSQLESLLDVDARSEEHTSELQSRQYFVCRFLLGKK